MSSSLILVKNPFDPRTRDERIIQIDHPSVAALVGEYLPAGAPAGVELVVSINGDIVPREAWGTRLIEANEQMLVMPRILDGDDGVLSSILTIAVMVFAPELAFAAYTAFGGAAFATQALFAASWVGMAMTAGISLLGSALIGSLVTPDRPSLPSVARSSFDSSPTYAWQPVTTQEPGGPIGRAYGRVKLYGNIIGGYIENLGDTGSSQKAHMLIDLGMGPYSALSDFEINDQPVANYRGVDIYERAGHLNQDIIPAFDDTRTTTVVGAKVILDAPVTRLTDGSNYDALDVVVTFPGGLAYYNNSGGLDALNVDLRVDVSADGGATWSMLTVTPTASTTLAAEGYPSGAWTLGFWTTFDGAPIWFYLQVSPTVKKAGDPGSVVYNGVTYAGIYKWVTGDEPVADLDSIAYSDAVTITHAQVQPVRRTFRIPNLTRGVQYTVRVSRLTAEHSDSRYVDDMYFDSLIEVLSDDFTYPRSVLVAVKALATEQLSGGLRFACMADAAIIRVWNGAAWSSAFSANPAWVCWDILTQPVLDNNLAVVRYDAFDPSRLDLPVFYAWAQWCDTLVSDGAGGTEARCRFDAVFDTAAPMWESALEVAANARAVLLMRGTTVTVVYDHARSTPAQLFTVGNTAENSFTETFLPLQDRAQAIEVDFINADNGHQRDKLTVVDVNVTEAAAQRVSLGLRGVRRPSQAWREAMHRLRRNQLLTRTGELGAGIDSVACTVGDLIWVQNDVTRWGEGGRAAAGSTTSTLMLDHEITLAPATTYELKLRLDDDTLLSRTVTTAAGTVTAVTVSEAFPSAPPIYAPWAIGEVNQAVKELLVTDIARDGDQRAVLGLIEYNASLYNVDTGEPTYPTDNISAVTVPVISNVTVEEVMVRAADGTIHVHLDLRWDSIDTREVVVFGYPTSGGFTRLGSSMTGHFRVAGVPSGETYHLQLQPITLLGQIGARSTWQSVDHLTVGKTAPPGNVTSFTATETTAGTKLQWGAVADVDLSHYELRLGATWESATTLGEPDSTQFVLEHMATGNYVLWVAAVDTSGNYSAAPLSATLYIVAPTVVGITLSEELAIAAGAVVSKVHVVIAATDSNWFYIEWSRDGVSWTVIDREYKTILDIFTDAGAGNFQIRVTPWRVFAGSVFNSAIYLVGKSAPPADVAGLTFSVQRTQTTLAWQPSEDLDVIVGGYLVLRYAAQYDAAWDAAIDVTSLPGSAISTSIPSLANGTWLARWLDSSDNYSVTAAAINVYSTSAETTLDTWAAEPAWSGTKYNTVVSAAKLTLDGINTVGTYRDAAYDYGAVCDGGVEVACTIAAYTGGMIDDRTALIDVWPDFDGSNVDDVAVSLWLRTTNDDPAGTPTWTDFRQIYGREHFTARAFQVELRITTADLTHNAYIHTMQVSALIEKRALYGADVVSGAATKSIAYSTPFLQAPAVGATPQDMATGDYYEITSRTASGFDITFKNSAGTAVSRTFDWSANGY